MGRGFKRLGFTQAHAFNPPRENESDTPSKYRKEKSMSRNSKFGPPLTLTVWIQPAGHTQDLSELGRSIGFVDS
jgi:hypothetical protein